MNYDQRSWNAYVEGVSNDPADDWRSRAFRPIIRNKIITVAAQVAGSVIYPQIYAQNENQEEDQDAAMVMRDLLEWSNDQSNGGIGYERTFLYAIINALVNPVSILYTEFAERYRTIKSINDDGKTWTEERVVDDVFSGFQDLIVPCDEIWIADIYEHYIQRQPYIIWRRVIDYETAKTKYGDNAIFQEYVKPGLQFLYVSEQNMFYQIYDQSIRNRLVEEVIYWNRSADLKLVFVNGILLDDPDQPNPRKDKRYPFAKTGYELIDEGRFFYYKSLPFKGQPDEEVVNTLYRMIIDGTYINIMPPAVIFGSEEVGSPVIAPGVVTTIDSTTNPNAAFETIKTSNNLGAGMNMLEKVESSISESTTSGMMGGSFPGRMTAYEMSRLEANAKVVLDLFAMMVSFFVKDFGWLRVGDILQFLTVGDAMQILDDNDKVKFRNFILPQRTVDGKTKTRKIMFDMNMPHENMGKQDMMDESYKLYQQEHDQYDEKTQIVKVNPTIFRTRKYSIKVEPEAVTPKTDAIIKAANLEEYQLAMANPLTDKEAITRDLLLGSYERTREEPDKYIQQQPSPLEQPNQQQPEQPLSPQGPQGALGAIPEPPTPQGMPSATGNGTVKPSRSLIRQLLQKG